MTDRERGKVEGEKMAIENKGKQNNEKIPEDFFRGHRIV